jgi:hypothetical protein
LGTGCSRGYHDSFRLSSLLIKCTISLVIVECNTGVTFQGLVPYYFQILHPGRALALNWCVWNSIAEHHLDSENKCNSRQDPCENCRLRPIEKMGLIHFVVCAKPWECFFPDSDNSYTSICRAFHHTWFKTRSAVDQSRGRSGKGTGDHRADFYFGYCTSGGSRGYQKMDLEL